MSKALPPTFVSRYQELLGPEVLDSLCFIPPTSREATVRLHPRRMTTTAFEQLARDCHWIINPLGFIEGGYSVNSTNGSSLTSTPQYFAGLYYIQESASMLPPLVLAPKPHSIVLDMTAAPGSKTTQMSHLMANTGVIIANDADPRRMKPLAFNVEKQGCQNVALCCGDASRFGDAAPEMFDSVLLDAPCSAEGSICKDPGYFTYWHENKIPKLAALQKQLLAAALKTCKVGGTIIYSTCTIAPEENEAVLDWMLQNYGDCVEIVEIPGFPDIPRSSITSWQGQAFSEEVKKAMHIIPTLDQHESFFVAKIKKTKTISLSLYEREDRRDLEKTEKNSFKSPPPSARLVKDCFRPPFSKWDTSQSQKNKDVLLPIIDRFGLDQNLFTDTITTEINEQYWLSGLELHEFLQGFPLKVDRSGLPLGRDTQKGFRMAFPFALAYGQHGKKNVAELDQLSTGQFIRGNTVSCSNEPDLDAGQVMVTREGMGLGRALFTGENPLKNQTPPEFVIRSSAR